MIFVKLDTLRKVHGLLFHPKMEVIVMGDEFGNNQAISSVERSGVADIHKNEFSNSGVVSEVITQSTISDKSKVVAALLCFFLGWLGVHRFYLGRVGTGVVMLIFTLLGWFTWEILIGFGFMAIVAIWELIDFIRILCNSLVDTQGRKLR